MDIQASRLKRAATRYDHAKTARDQAIRDAAKAGMTRRAIAQVVGLSHQRIHQIVGRDSTHA